MTVLWQVELGSAGIQLTSGDYSAFPHFWSVGFDRWGLGLVSWTDPSWGCFITPPGARECSSTCLAGGAGVLITELGKVPLFPHGSALLMRGTVCGWVVTASTWEGVLVFVRICWWTFASLRLQVCSAFLLCLNVSDLQRAKDHLSTFLPIVSANLASVWSFVFA